MNTYNIYKNGTLAVKNVPMSIVRSTTGINSRNISKYITDGANYHSANGNLYKFEYCEDQDVNLPGCGQKQIAMPQEWINDWDNNMRAAAQLIKDGKGKIKCHYVGGKYVRYTEAVR